MSLSKKIFIISSSLLALFLIFWGVYNLAFNKTSPQTVVTNPPGQSSGPTPATPNPNQPTETPSTTPGTIAQISDEAVIGPVMDPRGKNIEFYSPANGRAYRIDLDGQNKQAVNDQEIENIAGAFWAPSREKTILKTNQDGKIRFYYYNFPQTLGTFLKDNLDIVSWQNDDRIAYKYYDPASKKRSLNVSDPDGTNWKEIADIPYRDVRIAPVPQTSLVSFWNAEDALSETGLFTVPAIGGEAKKIFSGKFGVDYLWSPDGTKVLLSHSNERSGHNIQLAVINSQGGEYNNLNIPTFVSKCLWDKDGKTVYYAVPADIAPNAILPNDYASRQFNTTDTFWKIDIASGKTTRLVELKNMTSQLDAINLFLSADGSYLFFVNRIDSKLYRINL